MIKSNNKIAISVIIEYYYIMNKTILSKCFNAENTTLNKQKKFWTEIKSKIFYQLIKQFLPKNVFDFGCGSGIFLHQLAKTFKKTKFYGFDINKNRVEFIKNNFKYKNLKIRHLDIINDKMPKQKADLIILSDVIEHIIPKKISKLKSAISSSLNSKGILIIKTPNPYSFRNMFYYLFNRNLYKRKQILKPDQHKKLYSKKEVLRQFNNYELIEIIPFGFDFPGDGIIGKYSDFFEKMKYYLKFHIVFKFFSASYFYVFKKN